MVLRPYCPRKFSSLHYLILFFVFKLRPWWGLLVKTVNIIQQSISRQLTSNKALAFKRESLFSTSSRSYLQNEDPIDFASADNEQSI